jgi:hypothetical protein
MHLPKAAQEEWKIACKKELEALCWHNIFKLTNLPKGRKPLAVDGSLMSNQTVVRRPGL